MAPGDIPPWGVDHGERIARLEEAESERDEQAKRQFEWKKILITALLSFLLSGGGAIAIAKGVGWK